MQRALSLHTIFCNFHVRRTNIFKYRTTEASTKIKKKEKQGLSFQNVKTNKQTSRDNHLLRTIQGIDIASVAFQRLDVQNYVCAFTEMAAQAALYIGGAGMGRV